MKPEVLRYGEICINKNEFHKITTSNNIDEVDINRIILFDKTSYGNRDSFKYYIGYRHKNEALPSPLNTEIPQLTGYTKNFDNNNKYVNLLVIDEKLLKNAMKYGIRLKTELRKNLIKGHCIPINILVLK